MAVSALQRLLKYQELDGPGTAAESSSAAADAHKHHHHHHHHHHGRRRGGQLWKLDAALWSERDVLQVWWKVESAGVLFLWFFFGGEVCLGHA